MHLYSFDFLKMKVPYLVEFHKLSSYMLPSYHPKLPPDASTMRERVDSDDGYVLVGKETVSASTFFECVHRFRELHKIGDGSYGVVYRARDARTRNLVALKRVTRDEEGRWLREIKFLNTLDHPSIVNLIGYHPWDNLGKQMCIAMEYMDCNLRDFMKTKIGGPLSETGAKYVMLQILRGVEYLHDNHVLHRDLKPSNILVNKHGQVKICDMGMACRSDYPPVDEEGEICTLWYRAPELLLGVNKYLPAIDMWSMGCIMAEILTNTPLFRGTDSHDQFQWILKILGTPNEDRWPDFARLASEKGISYVQQPSGILKYAMRCMYKARNIGHKSRLSEKGFDLLNRMLTYDPKQRITVREALTHEWFRESPLPKANCVSVEFKPPWRP